MENLLTIHEIVSHGNKLYKHYDIFSSAICIHKALVRNNILTKERQGEKIVYFIADKYKEYFVGHYARYARSIHYDISSAVAIITLCAEYERMGNEKLPEGTVRRILGKLQKTKVAGLKNGGSMKTIDGVKMLSLTEIVRENFKENFQMHLTEIRKCLLDYNILTKTEYQYPSRKVYCYSVSSEMDKIFEGHYYATKKLYLGKEDNCTLYYDEFFTDFIVNFYKATMIYDDKKQLNMMKIAIMFASAIKYVPTVYDRAK